MIKKGVTLIELLVVVLTIGITKIGTNGKRYYFQ